MPSEKMGIFTDYKYFGCFLIVKPRFCLWRHCRFATQSNMVWKRAVWTIGFQTASVSA